MTLMKCEIISQCEKWHLIKNNDTNPYFQNTMVNKNTVNIHNVG